MNKKQFIETLRLKLIEERKLILSEVYVIGEVDSSGDELDVASGALIDSMNEQLSQRNAKRLIQIDSALQKIKLGTFGICSECEEPIANKRLEINPAVIFCVLCAEKKEKNLKK